MVYAITKATPHLFPSQLSQNCLLLVTVHLGDTKGRYLGLYGNVKGNALRFQDWLVVRLLLYPFYFNDFCHVHVNQRLAWLLQPR